jgi:hypothetical protein
VLECDFFTKILAGWPLERATGQEVDV